MNGRIYDPLIGRFLSADFLIQTPYNLQSYNRYSYVINNPLRYNDPSGYFWDTVIDLGSMAYGLLEATVKGTTGMLGMAKSSQYRQAMNAEPGNVDPYFEGIVQDIEAKASADLDQSTEAIKGVGTDLSMAAVPFASAAPRRIVNLADSLHDTQRAGEAADNTVKAASNVENGSSSATRRLEQTKVKSKLGDEIAERKPRKRGPSTDPNAPHNKTIREQGDTLETEGNTILAGGGREKERLIPTPGGHKGGRRPDILYETPEGEVRARNVGRTKADGSEIKREKEALEDLNNAGVPTDFFPYDR